MTIVNRGLNSIIDLITFSVLESNALVPSSKTNNSEFLYNALAIAILCVYPPESLEPPSPINVLAT